MNTKSSIMTVMDKAPDQPQIPAAIQTMLDNLVVWTWGDDRAGGLSKAHTLAGHPKHPHLTRCGASSRPGDDTDVAHVYSGLSALMLVQSGMTGWCSLCQPANTQNFATFRKYVSPNVGRYKKGTRKEGR